MKILIVESPGKVKKIQGFLGSEFKVAASVGHVRDLPEGEMGVEPPKFEPKYVPTDRGKKELAKLADTVKNASTVYLATDPDRERHMERLTLAEQFDVLAREYPSQKGLWWAKQTYLRMAQRKEVPSLSVMLSAIRRQKANPSWQRDCGRWIPHLSNWFTRHCWKDA